jgi:hypothetical protein
MQRTQELGPTEHEEIFKILRSHNIDHTQNNNGVFVNLNRVPDATIHEVQRFVDFCFDNKQDLDEYDKRLNECKLSQNYDRFLGVGPMLPMAQGLDPLPSLDAGQQAEEFEIQLDLQLPSQHGNMESTTVTLGTAGTSRDVIEAPDVDASAVTVTPYAAVTGALVPPAGQPSAPPNWAVGTKRMMNSKFHLAKKKYSKKRVADRRNDGMDHTSNELTLDPFLMPGLLQT